MTAFADSSALVKRYLDEPGAELVLEAGLLIATTLAAVEVSSAIWRRHRLGEILAADAGLLAQVARAELTGGDPAVIVIPPTNAIVVRASQLTGSAGLRAYDALQLATALEARDAYPDCTEFLCFDAALSSAAAAHGFAVNVG